MSRVLEKTKKTRDEIAKIEECTFDKKIDEILEEKEQESAQNDSIESLEGPAVT